MATTTFTEKTFEPASSETLCLDRPSSGLDVSGDVLSEKERSDLHYLKALLEIKGIGPASLAKLLAETGSPEALWNASDAFVKRMLSPSKAQAFLEKRAMGLDRQWLALYERLGIQVIPCTAAMYPPFLREIHQPPPILYVKGNLSALTGKTVAMVGTRQMSEYGRQVTDKLIGELASAGIVIVSGLAAGIDTAAHWAAIRNHLPTVAVYGCGLDIVYPSSNRKLSEAILAHQGALMSEYPLGTQPTRGTFPQRNRIVAGLSHGVVVVEGDLQSGALITARLALEEGRTVFAVPGNILAKGSQGPFYLLKNGATPVCQGEDILRDLQWWCDFEGPQASLPVTNAVEGEMIQNGLPTGLKSSSIALPEGLSEEERDLLERIPVDPIAIDVLQQRVGWPSAQFSGVLTLLELEGLIVQLPGASVCRK